MTEPKLIYPANHSWPKAVDTLDEVERTATRIRLVSGATGFEKISEFTHLEALWCFGIDQKKLHYIAECSSLSSLYLDYNLRAGDLSCLRNLPHLRILTLDSCSKIESLEQVAAMERLVALAVINFKNVHDLNPLARLRNLQELAIDGSMWTRMKVQSLAPLRSLSQLKYLSLSNTKVLDESLEPLGDITNLQTLVIANFYPFREFARLSTLLPDTDCQWFRPYIVFTLPCKKCQGKDRVMFTGKGRPILCQRCDTARIARLVKEFEEARSATYDAIN